MRDSMRDNLPESPIYGRKLDSNKLSRGLRFRYWLFKKIEPLFLKLQNSVLGQISRIDRARAIEEGTRLWKRFRQGQPVDALKEYSKRSKRDLSNCSHLKGGRVRTSMRDYAVYLHTFPDGTHRIKCTLCPKAWYPGDPGWKEAVQMCESSTNTASSSEVRLI